MGKQSRRRANREKPPSPTQTFLSDVEFDSHMSQLARLSPRKQAKWYKVLQGRSGMSTLRFKNGALVDCTPQGEQEVVRASDLLGDGDTINYNSPEAEAWGRMVLDILPNIYSSNPDARVRVITRDSQGETCDFLSGLN